MALIVICTFTVLTFLFPVHTSLLNISFLLEDCSSSFDISALMPKVTLKLCVCAQLLSRVWLFVTPWTVARQGPLSMGFSRQEYWSGLPFPPPGDLPEPRIKPISRASPTVAGGVFSTSGTKVTCSKLDPRSFSKTCFISSPPRSS